MSPTDESPRQLPVMTPPVFAPSMLRVQQALRHPQQPLEGLLGLFFRRRCMSQPVDRVPCRRRFRMHGARDDLHRVQTRWPIGTLIDSQVVDHIPPPTRPIIRVRPPCSRCLRKLPSPLTVRIPLFPLRLLASFPFFLCRLNVGLCGTIDPGSSSVNSPSCARPPS